MLSRWNLNDFITMHITAGVGVNRLIWIIVRI